MKRMLCLVALALPLAACDGVEGNGTTISINSTDGNSTTQINADANGRVSVDAPGFKGSITLPKMQITADSIDIDGAKLYPGSTVEGMSIFANDGGKGASGDGDRFTLRFVAPAALGDVQRWYRDELNKHGARVELSGDGVEGKTRDGKELRIEMASAGTNRTSGTLTVR